MGMFIFIYQKVLKLLYIPLNAIWRLPAIYSVGYFKPTGNTRIVS